ncbi:glycosyltransferase [Pontiella sulfatireligans]|uniref:Undecaprenyl-phosphate 4-deoxy-4-formamido-L-arabinose transferase n=1 Tax=Pontiella sulfatireligans TaxID=2750658 RepID=A0A6C2UM52_9BACT|nr:glycosyltransferase [Pontiella sulfatireligans]VGO20993.1 Undecaprenyl-phosphate 4-deoxy-4-formamido-L-arabinose transferase [Pontiella sulfatireligans]
MNQNTMASIVIPVFNEQENLSELTRRCIAACDGMHIPYEIILIDDGSRDGSARMISDAAETHGGKVVGVLLNRNYGQHAAVMAGFAHAKGDFIITLDADLQNPPEEIPNVVKKMLEGYDVVGTVRQDRQDSFLRTLPSRMVNKVVRKSTGVHMTDYGCMLRGYTREIVETMCQCRERSTFIPVLANTFAHKVTEIPVGHSERTDGDSKYSFWKLINLQFDLLTSITTFPLRVLSVVGGLVALAGIALGVLIIVLRILWGSAWAMEGVFTLFAILFVFVGAQFVGLGLLGEYIGRIYHDVRDRPRYFVRQLVGRKL